MKQPVFFLSVAVAIASLFFGQIFHASAQTLRVGAKGKPVTELQQFLSRYPAIYPEKIVTGYFGSKTEAAVRRFQKTYGIQQTGMVGQKTQAKMNELSAVNPTTPSILTPPPPRAQTITQPRTNTAMLYAEHGIMIEYFWPLDALARHLSAEEAEFLVYNDSASAVEFTVPAFSFTLEGKPYRPTSDTWEKFPSRESWERIEYININRDNYDKRKLILAPGQKAKFHYHLSLGTSFSATKQQSASFVVSYTIGRTVYDVNKIIMRPVTSPPAVLKSSPQTQQVSAPRALRDEWSAGKCIGSGPKTLISPPVRMNDIVYIDPMGAMSGSHVTPVDHLYFHGSKIDRSTFDVLAPADGYVVLVEIVPGPNDYRLIIEHSCTFYSIYIHITTLAKKLNDIVGSSMTGQRLTRIPVKSGEIIGTKIVDLSRGATQVDFSVANSDITLSGFIIPEHYAGEPWKIHTADPYDYYTEPLKSQLITKTNRSIPPIAGKIDYDIDGRLVGNWFLEGTNGYAGATLQPEYWIGHLTIAYDYYDPKKIRVSIGDWNGASKQFAVRGNMPDPKDVSISSGMMKYELVRAQYMSSGRLWDWSGLAKDITLDTELSIEGTLLVQLIAPRQLKLEIFPGLSATQITGFSSSARIYER